MTDQPGSFFQQLQACKRREADLRKVRDGLRERVIQLERRIDHLSDLNMKLELKVDQLISELERE